MSEIKQISFKFNIYDETEKENAFKFIADIIKDGYSSLSAKTDDNGYCTIIISK